jgi:hypothetical protein
MFVLLTFLACAPKVVKFSPVDGVFCERKGNVTTCTVSGSVGCSPVSLTVKP